ERFGERESEEIEREMVRRIEREDEALDGSFCLRSPMMCLLIEFICLAIVRCRRETKRRLSVFMMAMEERGFFADAMCDFARRGVVRDPCGVVEY
ncbi:hypothetical protein Tco_0103530, partial [Tanacetum coccineum]